MSARLERILFKLASQHAPQLVQPGWDRSTQPYRALARHLADHKRLVVMAHISQEHLPEKEQHVQRWVNTYARFYGLLTTNLFPTLTRFQARYADDALPPIIVLDADAVDVLAVMAGFVVPYVAARQQQSEVQDGEIRVLMDVILEEHLMCDDLSRPEYNQLVKDSIVIIRRMLSQPLRHIALTDFDQPLFGIQPQRPSTLPTQNRSVPPAQTETRHEAEPEPAPTTQQGNPDARPDASAGAPPQQQPPKLEHIDEPETHTPTERLFVRSIPIHSGALRRRPPVPDLPFDKQDDTPDQE